MAFNQSSNVVKAGWLYRQSTFLHRWKRNWFTLDKEGDLRYFENSDSSRAEERIVVRASVTHVKNGQDCKNHVPPEGVARSFVFMELVMRGQDTMVLCSDSTDDMKAWQIALEQARTMRVPGAPVVAAPYMAAPGYVAPFAPVYGGYGGHYPGRVLGYPGQVLAPAVSQQMISTPTGTTNVIVVPQVVMDDDPYRYRHRYGHRYGYGLGIGSRCHHHWW